MLTDLVRKIGGALVRKIATGKVRAAAEGNLGKRWHDLYWWAVGKKAWIGFVLAITFGVLEYFQVGEWRTYLGAAAVLFIEWGVLDKGWRQGVPDVIRNNAVYRLLASYPAELASLFAAAWAAVQAGHCWRVDCQVAQVALAILAALAVQVGLLDAAWRAVPPMFEYTDGSWRITVQSKGQPVLEIKGETRAEVEATWRTQHPDRAAA